MDQQNKKILLAITGGIAAYKAPLIVRELDKKGYDVEVLITKNGKQFVSTLSLETVSKKKVIDSMFQKGDNIDVEHIRVADQNDMMVIAPATANIIGKLASGIGDDIVTTTFLAFTKQILIVPAMNINMFNNPIVQKNINFLSKFENITIMEPDSGELACGYSGKGRMPDPDMIVDKIENLFTKKDYKNRNILITAGGTKEYIDPVRYISNPSSGKMGYALANEGVKRGANVTLLSAKNNLTPPEGAKVEYFSGVDSLYNLVYKHKSKNDILIMCAAVSDWKIKEYRDQKVKKGIKKEWNIELIPSIDILLSLKDEKNIIKVGFAAETENHIEHGIEKLVKKGLDMVVINDVSGTETGFQSNYNKVFIVTPNKDGNFNRYESKKMLKTDIASIILDKIKDIL